MDEAGFAAMLGDWKRLIEQSLESAEAEQEYSA
jgi:hypothetical protein